MGEYYTLVNHTREEKVAPTSVERGSKMYQWLSECTSAMGMYLLLNGGYSDSAVLAGSWAGDDVELRGDTRDTIHRGYNDISEELFEEMEKNIEDFPENMDSKFAKNFLRAYQD